MGRASLLNDMFGTVVRICGGECRSPFGIMPSGIRVLSLGEAIRSGAVLVEAFDGLCADAEGVLIDIPAGYRAEGTVCITVEGDGGCDVAISAGDGSDAELVFLIDDNATCDRFVSVCHGASLRVREVFASAAGESVAVSCRARIDGEAFMDTVTVELGDGTAKLSYATALKGAMSKTVHSGLFMAGDGERKSVAVRVEHRVPDCHSDVTMKGVAAGDGFGAFDGMLYVARDAQHTEAYQQSRNLIMGGKARILTSPQLEIYADDVKCSHGATVGQMNDDAVYYMRQRGLSEAEARGLQLAGFVNDIIMRFEGGLAQRVLEAAEKKIDAMQRFVE